MLTQSSVKVIADSVTTTGERITTLAVRYWLAIHPQVLTHRQFSRNASSARAIPTKELLEQVRNDPAGPLSWGVNRSGMQPDENLSQEEQDKAEELWRDWARKAADNAEFLSVQLKVHKQIANRILAPYLFINVLITSTEWDNFFNQRIHGGAQENTELLATQMKKALEESTPKVLVKGQWHLPYADGPECLGLDFKSKLLVSAARCARISYFSTGSSKRRSTLEEDIALANKLMKSNPKHLSPTEHQATPLPLGFTKEAQKNFNGWVQHRYFIEQGLDCVV